MQGTDGTTALFTPSIYTASPTLTIQRLTGAGGSPDWTVRDETMGSEVNVGGKIIYGSQLRLDEYTPTSGTLEGWYRLTFTLATGANCRITSVGNTEGTYLPTFTPRSTSIEIYIQP